MSNPGAYSAGPPGALDEEPSSHIFSDQRGRLSACGTSALMFQKNGTGGPHARAEDDKPEQHFSGVRSRTTPGRHACGGTEVTLEEHFAAIRVPGPRDLEWSKRAFPELQRAKVGGEV